MMKERNITDLAAKMLHCIREHYYLHPGPDSVHEVLNALGAVSAIVLQGTGPDQAAIDFFNLAVGAELRSALGGDPLPDRME